jgi:hypothetical protein
VAGKTVHVRIGTGAGQNRSIVLGPLAAALAFQGPGDCGCPAGGIAVLDEVVEELDKLVGEADGDLRGHTKTVSPRDADWDARAGRLARRSAIVHALRRYRAAS